jgi:hypothetical protein
LPHYRPSSHTAYQDAYSERTRKIAAAIYERDIDTFKYRF